MEAVGNRRPAQERHADLRPEPGRQPQCVPDRVDAAPGQIELPELGIDLTEVGHGRHDPGFERFDRYHVLDSDSHRVSGQALGVGDHDLVGPLAEHLTQGVDLGCGAAAPCRRVGLM